MDTYLWTHIYGHINSSIGSAVSLPMQVDQVGNIVHDSNIVISGKISFVKAINSTIYCMNILPVKRKQFTSQIGIRFGKILPW